MGTFTVDAIISDDDVLKHYRDRDHQGAEYDTDVMTDVDIGPYVAGTSLRKILIELWALANEHN